MALAASPVPGNIERAGFRDMHVDKGIEVKVSQLALYSVKPLSQQPILGPALPGLSVL